jgi:hypothetical protein
VTRVTATENRLVHADPDVETTLSALEAAGLVVVTHLVPVGQDAKTSGWFSVHCPRGCHDSVSIPNKVLTPLVKQRFLEWVTVILVDHDQADIGES